MQKHQRLMAPLFLSFYFISYFYVLQITAFRNYGQHLAVEAPSTSKSFVINYWKKQIQNNIPVSPFLLSKSSPLTTIEAATFSKLATQNSISSQISEFCSLANLLCVSNLTNTDKHQPYFTRFGIYLGSYAERSEILLDESLEPGLFFRESILKPGAIMPMPDIEDKMAKRPFLPQSVLSKLPFSSSEISKLKEIFHASDNSTMEHIIKSALRECERVPSKGETKRCVGSIEDMIDFAVSILGHNITVRHTDSTKGSKQDVMLGNLRRVNGGKLMKTVSCHQVLYPHLLYYCHSISRVRLYEADILDPTTKAKINHNIGICHVDTLSWSPTHSAFMMLGSVPGKIEVCHWIFENGMTWTVAD